MKLDRGTYEAWLLDRIEGTLTPGQERELDAFLAANPDLPAHGGDQFGGIGGPAEFPAKHLLRKTFPPAGSPDAARLDDFLAARLEKDLDAEQEGELSRYLYEHPEAARDAAAMARAKVVADRLHHPGKAGLEKHFPPKGTPDAHRLTDFLIAGLEGDLSPEQRQALQRYVNGHAGARREEMRVAATRVVPEHLAFPGKAGLKKQEVRVLPLWPRLAAAASILLLLGMGWWLQRERPADGIEVARVEKPVQHAAPAVPAVTTPPPADAAQPLDAAPGVEKPHAATSAPPGPMPEQRGKTHAAPSVGTVPVLVPAPGQQPGAVPILPPARPPLPIDEPTLAQQVPEPLPAENGSTGAVAAATRDPQPATTRPATHGTDQALGTYVANTIRSEVLGKPRRAAGLDGGDALALADKALGMASGGHGGMKVQRTPHGERFHLRLGRNLSISASRGR